MTVYIESFDTADSSTLGPDLTWTKFSAAQLSDAAGPGPDDGEISSNSYGISGGDRTGLDPCQTAAAFARAEHDTGSTSVYVQAELAALQVTDPENYPTFMLGVSLDPAYVGPLDGSTNDPITGTSGMWAVFEPLFNTPDGCGVKVYIYNADTHELLALIWTAAPFGGAGVHYTCGPVLAPTDVLRIDHDAVDSYVEVSINGVLVWGGSYDLGDMATPPTWGERGGIGIVAFNSPVAYTANVDRWDNFEAGVSSVVPPPPPPPPPLPLAEIVAELVDLSDLSTPLAALDGIEDGDRQFQEMLNDTGSGQVTFQNDDEDLTLVVPPNRLINFSVRDVLAFTMLCEHFEATLVDQNEEAAEVTVWSGRGHSALLERAVTYPSNGVDSWPVQEDRIFNYTDPDCFDDSSWDPAEVICDMTTAKASWPGALWSADFVDNDASVLGAPGDTLATAILGTRYVRQSFDVPADGHYSIDYAGDDTLELYVDGSPIASTDRNQNFTSLNRQTIDLTAGTHVISFAVTNMPWAGPDADPCGGAWSIVIPGFPATVIAHSDSSAVVTMDGVTGMTPGAAILCLLNEAQARGAIPYITTSFDETVDTAGTPWPVVPDISTKVGTSFLTFLKELSATYIDWRMAPGTFVLDAWVIGGRTTTPGVDFHSPTDPDEPTTGNLTGHKETGEA